MTRDLASDLAYLEGQVSVALRHDAGRKIKCKQGYVQRGSACQKINPNKAEGEVATTTSNPAKTRNAYLQGSAAILGLAVPALAIALSKKGAEAKEFLKQEGIAGLIDSGVEISTKIQGKEASIKKADSPLTTFRRVGRAAIGLYVAKDLAEYAILKAMGLRLETHSTSKENAKKIIEGGGYLDPSKGGSGAAAGLEDFKNNSTGYVHITGVHDKLYTHDPVFVSNFGRDEDGNFSMSARKFVGWVKKDKDPYLSEADRESLGLKMSDGDFLAKGRMPANPVLGYLTGKMQRVMYSGMGGLSEEEKKLPIEKQIPKAFLKSLTGRGGKTLYVANTEQFFRDNFVPDSDDFALKTDKPLKVYSNKYEAIFNAVKDKYRKDSDDRLSIEDDDLVMLGALISSAKRIQKKTRSDSRKLKCKEGYVQRGSACQKVSDKKGSNNLARNIGAGLGVAALAGAAGVAIASRRQGGGQVPIQLPQQKPENTADKVGKILGDKRVRTAAIATGTAAALASSVMGVNALDKKYQITDAALLTAYQASISQGERADKLIDGMKISDANKAKARDLIGATKMFFAKQIVPRWGFELASVDSKANSFTYKHKDNGSVYTMGSAGSAIITFGSLKRDEREGNPIYEMGFQVNEAFDRKGGMDSTTAKKIIRISKNAFKEHLSLLPDDCIIRCSPYDGDDAGKKRGSIYEKEGFTSIPGMPKTQLYAVKMDGEFTKLDSDFEKKYVAHVVKNGKQSASSESKKDSLLRSRYNTTEKLREKSK